MNAAAPWLLPTNGRITVTVKPGIGAYTRFRTLPAVPWLHVRNQEKRFAREHFAFARQEKRFAREHFAFARSKSHFLVADELASFSDNLSTLRRTQPVQARGSAARVTPKATTFLKIFTKHRKNERGFPSLADPRISGPE